YLRSRSRLGRDVVAYSRGPGRNGSPFWNVSARRLRADYSSPPWWKCSPENNAANKTSLTNGLEKDAADRASHPFRYASEDYATQDYGLGCAGSRWPNVNELFTHIVDWLVDPGRVLLIVIGVVSLARRHHRTSHKSDLSRKGLPAIK